MKLSVIALSRVMRILSLPEPENRQGSLLMSPDILIIYDDVDYRLLHGHLHLAVLMGDSDKATVEVKDHGTVFISRSRSGLVVEVEGNNVPLLTN
jgi:hypothetical protein